MKKLLILFFSITFCGQLLVAQGEIDEQQKIFFRNERSFGILLNTNGMGISYRDARRINFLNKRYIEVEAGSLRHPKEYRQSSYYNQAGSFVFGKLNSVFYLRASIGKQHEMFKKADLGGVAVRYFYSAGPALAVYKPVYYRILRPLTLDLTQFEIVEEKFDVTIHQPYDIYSRASFFKGFGEMKVQPGIFAKGGFNFEYSKEEKMIHAIEIGAQINGFLKEIPIMATADNKSIFFSLFASYRFGIVIDPLNPESNKLSNLFRRRNMQVVY